MGTFWRSMATTEVENHPLVLGELPPWASARPDCWACAVRCAAWQGICSYGTTTHSLASGLVAFLAGRTPSPRPDAPRHRTEAPGLGRRS